MQQNCEARPNLLTVNLDNPLNTNAFTEYTAKKQIVNKTAASSESVISNLPKPMVKI